MQARLSLTRDTISPDLRRALKATENPRPALQAVGLYIEARAKRAFDEPGLRPAAWAALKPATLRAKAAKNLSSRILRANGTLWRSIRITEVTRTRVTVGTDRFHAKFHQLGTKRMPARPFFPFLPDGRLVPAAKSRVELAMRRKLGQGGVK
jgi:phage gpG-like protein